MQLLYLWIKDYKSIKETGFNFSSEWNFSYDAQQNKLTAERQTSIPKNFFGEQFLDVTVIVGENGTGKSSLLDFIVLPIGHYLQEKGVIFLLGDEFGNLYTFSLYEDIQYVGLDGVSIYSCKDYPEDCVTTIFQFFDSGKKNAILYYSPVIDYQNVENINLRFDKNTEAGMDDRIFNISSNYFLKKEERGYVYNDVLRSIRFLNSSLVRSLGNLIFSYTPNDITIFYSKVLGEESYLLDSPSSFKEVVASSIIHLIEKEYQKNEGFSVQGLEELKAFYVQIINGRKEEDSDFEVLKKALNEAGVNNKFLDYLDEISSKGSYNASEWAFDIPLKGNTNLICDFIESYQSLNLGYRFRSKWGDSITDILTFSWRDLSFGERTLLNILSRFFSLNEKIHEDNEVLLIAIDEGDLGFHPDWQKKYFSILVKFLPLIFKNQKIQLILSTHSPFILSDIPKSNCIFLKKDEKGNSKVDEGLAISNTFGANIHELLADAFFMKGGLIGDFAKGKINELLKRLSPIVRYKQLRSKAILAGVVGTIEQLLEEREDLEACIKWLDSSAKRTKKIKAIIKKHNLAELDSNFSNWRKVLTTEEKSIIKDYIPAHYGFKAKQEEDRKFIEMIGDRFVRQKLRELFAEAKNCIPKPLKEDEKEGKKVTGVTEEIALLEQQIEHLKSKLKNKSC
ncbi:AAA family ATPase [Saprospira grandis]|uniref:ATPase AAA-type core domain-containing protein n=1 Tax=Saprospira grandis (strain Lewin) TaxID=984262 RepID=H6LAN6_SAPGL|nr:AAA family ATPase [Saprospira grandis]AFC25629.1 hypothetical protein SGRA_2901 [Saprospira grandis str. Lewin]